MSKNLDAILDESDFAFRDVPICLKRSARSRWDALQAELLEMTNLIEGTRDASGKVQATAGRIAARAELATRVRDIEEEIRDNTVVFRIVGMPFPEYNAILIDHPPRDGNMVDRAVGYNVATFHPALVRVCIEDPKLTDEQWERLVARLSDGDFDRLATAANEVNRRLDDGRVPFSQTASVATSDSGPTSSSLDG
jgi:hypothetical protein